MRFSEMNIIEQLDYATRNIIVLSICYYDLNETVVSDKVYDSRLKYLCKLANDNKDVLTQCYYYDILKDIHPSTGFDLKYKLIDEHRKYLETIASQVIKGYKERGGKRNVR